MLLNKNSIFVFPYFFWGVVMPVIEPRVQPVSGSSHPRDHSIDSSYMQPTNARYGVILFAVILAIISYIDRVCISKAEVLIRADLGLTKEHMGLAMSAFFWAYALFEIPGGWLGDRIGAKKALVRVVIWWSVFTALTGWVGGLVSLIVVRALFGAGEAGCFPNITKSFTVWLPTHERVKAQGIMWLSARWGGALTPFLVGWVLMFVSWRRAFEIFALLGIVWAIFFWWWYKDNPREHPSVNDAEKKIIPDPATVTLGHGKIPWMKFVTTKDVMLLWGQYFCMSFPWVFYVTWLPTYLREARGVPDGHFGSLLAGIPLFLGGIGCLLCGYILPRVATWLGDVGKARRLMACTGFGGAALLWVISMQIADPLTAMLVFGLASFSNDLAMPPSWAAAMDMGGKYTGTLSGSMNMFGNFGAALFPAVAGYILAHTANNWNLVLYIAASVYLVGVMCWYFIDPVTPLDEK